MAFTNLLTKLFQSLKRLLIKRTKTVPINRNLSFDSSSVIPDAKKQLPAERPKTKFKQLIEEYYYLEGLSTNKDPVLDEKILDNETQQGKNEIDSLVNNQIENNTTNSVSIISNNDHNDKNSITQFINKKILIENEIVTDFISLGKKQEVDEFSNKDLPPIVDEVTNKEVNDKNDNNQEMINENFDTFDKLDPCPSSSKDNDLKPDSPEKKEHSSGNYHKRIDIKENVSLDSESIESVDGISIDSLEKQTKIIQKESHEPHQTFRKKGEVKSSKKDFRSKNNLSQKKQLFQTNIEITEKEFLTFKKNLSNGLLINFTLETLNAFLMKFFEDLEFIGELPVTQEAFNQICQLIQKEGLTKYGNPKTRVIPPAVFVSSMVLCAQFSKEEARNFWLPYAKMVWNTDEASQNFQRKCRDHFIYCRSFLRERFGFDFPVIRNGDVVRPIYYQAIIPHYLQLDFANWLVDNQIWISNSSMEDLIEKLHNGFNMDNIPSQLSNFMQAKDTENTVVNLIMRMVAALSLYHETNNETVEAVLNSQIQKSIWKNIINVMLEKKSQSNRYLSRSIRLTWLWDTSDNELYLKVFNVIASQQRIPGAIVWDSSTAIELLDSEVLEQIYLPPNFSEEGYLIDPIKLSDGPIDGNIYILSKDYDEVNCSLEERKKFIIYNEPIPKIIQNKICNYSGY